MSFRIRRGQSVNWRMTMMSGTQAADMTGGTWCVAESSFRQPPTFSQGGMEARLIWTPEQTLQMTPGKKRLRLKYVQPNGEVKVFPDLSLTVE